MLLDQKTLELIRRRDALRAAKVDPYADRRHELGRVTDAYREAEGIDRQLLALLSEAVSHELPGLSFDGCHLGSPLHLLFTDIDPLSPARGGTFAVNLEAERDAQRARFEAGQLAPVSIP